MWEEDEAVGYLIRVLEELEIPYAIGGSLASARWGEPRATLDADIVVDMDRRDLERLLERLPAEEFYVSPEAAREALRLGSQFNAIHMATSFKIDFFLPDDDVARAQIVRSRRGPVLPGVEGAVSPPEELIVKKLSYYQMGESDKHLRDIAGIVMGVGEALNRARIAELADSAGVAALWKEVLTQLEQP